MTIYEQIKDTLGAESGRIFTAAEIKQRVHERFGTNLTSIIPSDYCYNRRNQGIRFNQHLFVRLNPGEYRYVGENYPYDGWVFERCQGGNDERIAGEWRRGVLNLYDELSSTPVDYSPVTQEEPDPASLSREQIQRLYEEYLLLLELEVQVFGCKPTETRHLIGRIGEFRCALSKAGTLARKTNQQGFDVVTDYGTRISVKTTAQKSGFISINQRTVDQADRLMILQYRSGEFDEVYFGPIATAVSIARNFRGKFELDLGKAKMLQRQLETGTDAQPMRDAE